MFLFISTGTSSAKAFTDMTVRVMCVVRVSVMFVGVYVYLHYVCRRMMCVCAYARVVYVCMHVLFV